MTGRDGGVSDVVGTMVMLGVTIVLAAIAALQVGEAAKAEEVPIALDVTLWAHEGGTAVHAMHVGGSSVPLGDLRALLFVDGALESDGPPGGAGAWALGDRVVFPLAAPLAAGSHVALDLVHDKAGIVAHAEATAVPAVSASAGQPAGFTATLTLAGGASPVVIEPPAGLRIEAKVTHPEGRKFVRFVYADFSGFDGPDWQELRDDGVNGDASTADGVWSAMTLVPVNTTSGLATVRVTAIDFNGARVSATASVTLLTRNEVTEQDRNPTGAPAPGGSVCPIGNAAIRSLAMRTNGGPLRPTLEGNVRQGDEVEAFVTLAEGCVGITITLASYKSTSPSFSWENATASTLYQSDSRAVNAGASSFVVRAPSCYFTIDLARGALISTFGPANSNNYYSRQGRLLDSDNGGVSTCA